VTSLGQLGYDYDAWIKAKEAGEKLL
jgi:hypothetical protein